MIRIGILGNIGSGKSYVANNLGYPVLPEANVAIFSETVIYKAFIHFCKINKNVPIESSLKMICIDTISQYDKEDPIEIKIKKMKQEGKLYSIDSFYQLMQVVNTNNIIHFNNKFSSISRYHILEETLIKLEDTNNKVIPVEIRDSLKTLMDTFDVTLESKTKEMLVITRMIKTERKKLEKQIVKLKTTGAIDRKERIKIDKFLTLIDKEHNTNIVSYISYVKEFIKTVCNKYPIMIKNKINFDKIPIPKHWRITSYNHTMDIIKSVSEYYKPLQTFYDNDDIVNIIDLLVDDNNTIVSFMDSLPYFSSYTDTNQVKLIHVLDEDIILNIYNFLLIKSLSLYLDNIANVRSTYSSLSEDGGAEEEKEGLDVRVELARQKTIQQSVKELLIMYMDRFVVHYEKTEPSYNEISKRTLYSKEKEKIELVSYMSEMSDEQRNAEQALRATGQGRWATGQQKGYKEYQGSVYDEETRQARESSGAIDFTGEYMKDVDDQVGGEEEPGFDEEADALDMGTIMEDDEGDEDAYMMSPVDNE